MAKLKREEEKVTQGFNLSRENLMAVKAYAFELSLKREDGKTVSASAVLNSILDEWRKKRALAEIGARTVTFMVRKGKK